MMKLWQYVIFLVMFCGTAMYLTCLVVAQLTLCNCSGFRDVILCFVLTGTASVSWSIAFIWHVQHQNN